MPHPMQFFIFIFTIIDEFVININCNVLRIEI
jgi:hypothetical protein